MHELDSIAVLRETRCRDAQCVRVAVQPDHAFGPRRKQCRAMTPETGRTVDEGAAARGGEQRHHLVKQDRFMADVIHRRSQIPNWASARASSSVYGSRCSFAVNRSWFQTSR